MKIHTVETLAEFQSLLGLAAAGRILETDLDEEKTSCDANGRRRRDAEVLCTLAANVTGNCLDLGTSHGRSAFKIASNLESRGQVYTVNLLPDQRDTASGQDITHLLTRDEIGQFYRSRGATNVTQIFADTAKWTLPETLDQLALVFVDAAHDANRVCQDSHLVFDRVKAGGFVCWHDFSPQQREQFHWIDSSMRGVEQFFAQAGLDGEIIHLKDSWIGVYRKPVANGERLRLGLICDRSFQEEDRWTVNTTSHLVNGFIRRFDTTWIQSQQDYERCLGDVDLLISMEPVWAATVIDFVRTPALRSELAGKVSLVLYSDTHKDGWREDYFLNNQLDRVLAFYDAPTRRNFRRIPQERIIHFPWTMPDQWISRAPIVFNGQNKLMVFGGSKSPAYTVRNWCRTFPFVESSSYSGVENRVLKAEEFMHWLSRHDAIIAAGADDPKYRLTTPKYFEICASGALLFGQETDDLGALGFRHMENCVIFDRANFEKLAMDYCRHPQDFLDIRLAGRELVRSRHTLSRRLDVLERHVEKIRAEKVLPRKTSVGGAAKLVEAEVRGLRFRLNPERYLDRELLDGGTFEAGTVQALEQLIRPGMVALDVGANIGYYTLLFSKWTGPTGQVIAFEPTRDYGDRLRDHVALNHAPNVHFEAAGLSDAPGSALISVGQCSATMHWVDASQPRQQETIRLTTLDAWWSDWLKQGHPDRLDVVKVDVDGHEPRFLRGAARTLQRHRPILLIEFSRPHFEQAGFSPDAVLRWLENDLGYEILDGTHGKPFASRSSLVTEIHRTDVSCNLLCVPQPAFPMKSPQNLAPDLKPVATRKPTIFVHADEQYRPDQWYRRFVEVLGRCPAVNVEVVDLLEMSVEELAARVQPGDGLVGRFGHIPQDLARIRPIYGQLHRLFGGRIFPKRHTYEIYDDKRKQSELFAAKGYPQPKTRWVENLQEVRLFMQEAKLDFPLVVKKTGGAGSSGVQLADAETQINFPCLVQELCAGNRCDWRVNVIGHRVMGFVRFNRDNDFRASGSGRLWYPAKLPEALLELAARISQENGFESMAYDFVQQNGGWRVLEISYTYQDNTVGDCANYWDSRTGEWGGKAGIYPEDFILEDFLREHYGIVLAPQPTAGLRVLSRTYGKRLPRILLVVDVANWIFERHAFALAERLRDEFDFDLAYQFPVFDERNYDLIYALEFNLLTPGTIKNPRKYVTGIRSHHSWEKNDFAEFTEYLRANFQRVHVVSERLRRIFAPHLPNVANLPHGIAMDAFQPASRADQSGRGKLRLGWAGNRQVPVKGFDEFVAPLGQLPGVELIFCGYHGRNLPLEQMKGFYDSLDAYVCASTATSEGNNNSMMEAAAMARAIITTDNGTVPEYLRDGESALIVERNLPAFIRAVERLRDRPELRMALGTQARKAALAKWDWKDRVEDYRRFFREAQNHGSSQPPAKRPTANPSPNPTPAPTATNPARLEQLLGRSAAFIKSGDVPAALHELVQAAELAPDDADLLDAIGTLFTVERNIEAARKYYCRALAADPQRSEVRRKLLELTIGTDARLAPVTSGNNEAASNEPAFAQAAAPARQETPVTGMAPNQQAQLQALLVEASKAIGALDWPAACTCYHQAQACAGINETLAEALRQTVANLDDLIARSKPADISGKPALPGGVSFCIITNGKRPEKLHREIASIHALGMPDYEILVGGEVPDGLDRVRVVQAPDAARGGRLGEMRNRLTEQARFDHLVVADDDLVFLADFYDGLLRFGEDYEVQCVRLLNPDGTRYWDWSTFGGPRGHVLLSYAETDPHVYVTGGLCIMKTSVARRLKWDEGIGYYEGEDIEFSFRLRAAGISIKFNSHSTVIHHDLRLTQFGEIVISAEGLRQRAIAHLQQPQQSEAEHAFQRLRLFQPEMVDADSGIIHAVPESLSVARSQPRAARRSASHHKQIVIGIDGRTFYHTGSTARGIGHYAFNHLKNAAELRPDWRFVFYVEEDKLSRTMERLVALPNVRVKQLDSYRPGEVDLFHIPDPMNMTPGFDSPMRLCVDVPSTAILYDITPRRFYWDIFSEEGRKAYQARLTQFQKRGVTLLAISEFSRQDLLQATPITPEKVITIMAGLNRAEKSAEITPALVKEVRAKYGITAPFFLHVGALDPHKNFGGVVKAMGRIRSRHGIQLVVVGEKENHLKAYADECERKKIRDILFPGYIPRLDLEVLYHETVALLFLSWYEGFGFPVLEAMAQGCPVVTTNVTSIPEVAGDAALQFAPDDTAAISRGMQQLLDNRALRETLRAKGLVQATKFPWIKPAQKTIEVWEQILGLAKTATPAESEKSSGENVRLEPVPKSANAMIVSWEGSFLDHGSLSHVNRELIGPMKSVPDLQIRCVTNGAAVAADAAKIWPALAGEISAQPAAGAAVTVRHAWPPNWKRPAAGKLAVIQPWEFGSLPQTWVNQARDVDEFWVPSNYVRDVYIASGVPAEKVVVVPNGVDAQKFHPQSAPMKLATAKKFKFLFVGGTIGRKGPDLLLHAYVKNFTAADDVCLVIKDFGGQSVYTGQTFEAQIRAAQALPNAPEILYLNAELPPETLPGLYTACDCLVMPYRGEGFGLPVLEAMACGLPVIVTAGGATDDFVRDEFAYRIPAVKKIFGPEVSGMKLVGDGWMLEPDVALLGEKMRQVFSQPGEARERGQLASRHAHQFWSWKNSAAIAAQRLRELAAKPAVAPAPAAAQSPAVKPAPVAEIGRLNEARELFGQKNFADAWTAALTAIAKRPFHPEAFLLLAEIALAAGNGKTARLCAQRAREFAPGWQAAKQFLTKPLKGDAKLDWLGCITHHASRITPVRLPDCQE